MNGRRCLRISVAWLALAFLGAWAAVSWANNVRVFTTGNNAFGTTNAYAIVPAVGGKIAIVRTLAVSTDSGVGRITIYSNAPPVSTQSDAGTGNTNFMVQAGTGAGGTNGFAVGDNVIIGIGNTPSDSYFRVRVAAVTTTNIQIFPATAPGPTVVAGSRLWRVGTNAVLVGVTNGATSLYNSFVAASEVSQPLLIDIWAATSSCFINACGGEYVTPLAAPGTSLTPGF